MGDKFLTEKGWKDVAPKDLKDRRLADALNKYAKLDEEKYDERIKALDEVIKAAGDLKKTLAKTPALVKYLADVAKSAESEKKNVADDKAKLAKLLAEHKARDVAQAYKDGLSDGSQGILSRGPQYVKDLDILKSYNKGFEEGLSEAPDGELDAP